MCTDKDKIFADKEYMNIVKDLLINETVLKMKQYRQHFNVSCFDHCLFVSYNAYLVCKKHNLDYKSVARAGLLHDLYLYNWRKRENGRKGLHAYTHGRTALENAMKIADLNDKEKDIIRKHMWPVTVALPKYKETFVITYVDKIMAIVESRIA